MTELELIIKNVDNEIIKKRQEETESSIDYQIKQEITEIQSFLEKNLVEFLRSGIITEIRSRLTLGEGFFEIKDHLINIKSKSSCVGFLNFGWIHRFYLHIFSDKNEAKKYLYKNWFKKLFSRPARVELLVVKSTDIDTPSGTWYQLMNGQTEEEFLIFLKNIKEEIFHYVKSRYLELGIDLKIFLKK